MEAVLIALLAVALFATIWMLSQALFSLRQGMNAMGSELADIRERLARIEARFDVLETQ